MSNIKTIEGSYTGASAQYVVVITRWNSWVVDSLVKGARDALGRHGVAETDITLVKVPGAFELPLAVQKISQGSCDAIIALGAVIRGGTPHFEYVAGECVKGLGAVSMASSKPVSFGVLTVDNIEQAVERSGAKAGNKGEEAALTAVEMVSLMRKLDA